MSRSCQSLYGSSFTKEKANRNSSPARSVVLGFTSFCFFVFLFKDLILVLFERQRDREEIHTEEKDSSIP